MGVLSFLTFLPLIGGLVILFVPAGRAMIIRFIATAISGLGLAASIWIWTHINSGVPDLQFVERVLWIPSLNIHYYLGTDGLSLPLVVLTEFLTLIALISSYNLEHRVKEYFFFFLLLETAVLGVFLSLDLFLFYVFWELTLVPMFFLIGMWGGPKKEYAALKFFLFTLAGSVFMLIAILALYFLSAPHTFDVTELMAQSASWSRQTQLWIFGGLFLGFAVKIPLVPLHTWLPEAYVEAPAAVCVVLAGVLAKMGVYGLLRVSFPVLPLATQQLAMTLAILAAVNSLYGAFCALAQTDIKRMVAYSSINHMGYAVLGIASLSTMGLSGSVLQMVSHGVITGALFLLVGALEERGHSRELTAFGGLAARLPILSGLTIVACFASLGLPLLSGFIAEFLCFLSAFQVPIYRPWAIVALGGVLITAAYFLILIKKVFYGPLSPAWESKIDLEPRELMAIVPLVVAMLVLGFLPSLVLQPMSATLSHLVDAVRMP